MSNLFPKNRRRADVVINFLSAILIVVVFCIGEYGTWNGFLGILIGLLFLILIFSFIKVYGKTGIWEQARSKADQLDERELSVVHDSYRLAYSIFTIISLLVIFFIVLSVRFSFFTLTHRGHYSFGLIILFFLNYLLYILPCAIIGWTEQIVER
jgi:hypothetical protein